jgi:hypothetical protein
MELHFWLIPGVAIVAGSVVAFYFIIKRDGGSGVRNAGRTLFDKPVDKKESKADWNFYGKP